MADGGIMQIGSPRDVYEEPATASVADFLGTSNLMTVRAQATSGLDGCRVRLGDFELSAERGDTHVTGEVRMVIRPERIQVEAQGTTGTNRIPGMVERLVYLGSITQVMLRLVHGESLQAMVSNQGERLDFEQGTPVTVFLPPEALRVLKISPEALDGGDPDAGSGSGPSLPVVPPPTAM
jgi:ABC-type Fe3+/spermidine/putrescine transport system ATPase subunit